jgi:hypothetical protein
MYRYINCPSTSWSISIARMHIIRYNDTLKIRFHCLVVTIVYSVVQWSSWWPRICANFRITWTDFLFSVHFGLASSLPYAALRTLGTRPNCRTLMHSPISVHFRLAMCLPCACSTNWWLLLNRILDGRCLSGVEHCSPLKLHYLNYIRHSDLWEKDWLLSTTIIPFFRKREKEVGAFS